MEQRWGFLGPWCDALKHRVSYQAGKFAESPVTKRSLCVSLPRRESMDQKQREEEEEDFSKFSDSDRELFFRKQFQKTREAMALLAAVAHVDYAAWRFLLESHCSVNLGGEGEPIYEEKISVRYVINLDQEAQVVTGQDLEFYEYDIVFFFGTHQRLHPSEEYRKALWRIASLDQNARRRESGFEFDVPVRVQFDPLDDYDDVKGLVEVAIAERMVKEQWGNFGRSAAAVPGEWRCSFVLERMIADLTPLTVPGEMGAAIKTLLGQNTWFALVSVCLVNVGMPSTQAFGQLVSSVFDSVVRPPELANASYHPGFDDGPCPLQVGEVRINWNPDLQTREAGALCSAMAHTQLSKTLSLRLWMSIHNRESNQQHWKWLAYALFSKRARVSSSVQSLALMKVCSMSAVDMEAFTSILKSEHPEEDLFDSSPGRVESRKATLNAGTLVRCVLDDRNGSTETIAFDAQVVCVRTFSDDGRSTWVDCIVPGYGRCRVQQRDLVFDDSSSGDKDTSACGEGITSLRLHLNKASLALFDGISRFFGAVGAPLLQLILDAPRGDLSSILQFCPILEELALCGGVVDARLNFRDCHARGEPLPELNLNWDSISAIATVLADNDNKLVKCVRRVRVRVNNFPDEDDNLAELRAHERRIRTDFTALLRMLEENRYLEYLEVVVHPEYKRYLHRFRRHHLQPIWCALSPLSLRSKLAFLSRWVVKPTAIAKRARSQFKAGATLPNTHVLRIIFEFAADPVLREVYFRKSDRIVTETIEGEESI